MEEKERIFFMTYIVSFNLDCSKQSLMSTLTHLGAYHNLVEHLFPREFQDKVRLRHLWRKDGLHLTVVSRDEPDMKVIDQYQYRDFAKVQNYDYFIGTLKRGQKFNFRLAANPILRRGGKIIPHTAAKYQMQWLERQAENNGFKLLNSQIDSVTHPVLRRRKNKGNNTFWLNRVDYTGILEITDLAKFRHALTDGVGRERAFGMGLLLLGKKVR